MLFLDLSQGTVFREIGLAGLQLPPLPFLEVAPLSTDAVATDFTASLQESHISAAVKELLSFLAVFGCGLSCMSQVLFFPGGVGF